MKTILYALTLISTFMLSNINAEELSNIKTEEPKVNVINQEKNYLDLSINYASYNQILSDKEAIYDSVIAGENTIGLTYFRNINNDFRLGIGLVYDPTKISLQENFTEIFKSGDNMVELKENFDIRANTLLGVAINFEYDLYTNIINNFEIFGLLGFKFNITKLSIDLQREHTITNMQDIDIFQASLKYDTNTEIKVAMPVEIGLGAQYKLNNNISVIAKAKYVTGSSIDWDAEYEAEKSFMGGYRKINLKSNAHPELDFALRYAF